MKRGRAMWRRVFGGKPPNYSLRELELLLSGPRLSEQVKLRLGIKTDADRDAMLARVRGELEKSKLIVTPKLIVAPDSK